MPLKTDWQDFQGQQVTAAYLNALGTAVNGGSASLELDHDFTNDTTGAFPTLADTGQTWTQTYGRVQGIPVIAGGRWTSQDSLAGVSATYITAGLAGSVTYMEADWEFGASGSTNGQNAVLAAWTTNLIAAHGTSFGVFPPDSPCHCVITGTLLQFACWQTQAFVPLGTYTFPTPLGVGPWHAEITIDRARNRATVLSPDGVTLVFQHALIGSLTAPFVTEEIYTPNPNTDKKTMWKTFKATSAPVLEPHTVTSAIADAQLATINPQTGAYTLAISDINRVIEVTSASAVNVTVPPELTVGFPIGAPIDVVQGGAGRVTLVAGAGVTLNTSGSLLTRAQYSTLSLRKRAANTWIVTGDSL